MSSKIIFCTSKLPLARFIAWFTVGYAHAALILPNGNWLDARGGGVKERAPEKNLLEYEIVTLPFDIENEMRSFIGKKYNFQGIVAQWLRFKWRSRDTMFCNESILAACRRKGRQIVDEGREDKMTPIGTCDSLKAYLRGLNG